VTDAVMEGIVVSTMVCVAIMHGSQVVVSFVMMSTVMMMRMMMTVTVVVK